MADAIAPVPDGDVPPTPNTEALHGDLELIKTAGRQTIIDFLRERKCYDIILPSAKIIVLDQRISIQLAFYAIVEHGMQAAPIWDSKMRIFVGLLVVNDFIDLLRDSHRKGCNLDEFATMTIESVITSPDARALAHPTFTPVSAEDNVYTACCTLHRHNVSHVPLVSPDTSNVLSILSAEDILNFFVKSFREQRRLFDNPISALGIGTYTNITTTRTDTTLLAAIDLMDERNISSIPIVDEQGRVVTVYPRSDISFIASAKNTETAIKNLLQPVGEIINRGAGAGAWSLESHPDRTYLCSAADSLQSIFELYNEVKFKRLLCLDEQYKCVGVITTRDLIQYFVDR